MAACPPPPQPTPLPHILSSPPGPSCIPFSRSPNGTQECEDQHQQAIDTAAERERAFEARLKEAPPPPAEADVPSARTPTVEEF